MQSYAIKYKRLPSHKVYTRAVLKGTKKIQKESPNVCNNRPKVVDGSALRQCRKILDGRNCCSMENEYGVLFAIMGMFVFFCINMFRMSVILAVYSRDSPLAE